MDVVARFVCAWCELDDVRAIPNPDAWLNVSAFSVRPGKGFGGGVGVRGSGLGVRGVKFMVPGVACRREGRFACHELGRHAAVGFSVQSREFRVSRLFRRI